MGRSQTDGDERETKMSSEEPSPATTAPTSSSATKDSQGSDKAEDASRPESASTSAAPTIDAASQSVLLALITQPIVKPDTQAPTPALSDESTNSAMESALPVVTMAETSLPVAAAPTTVPQTDSQETTAASAATVAAVQSDAVPASAVDKTTQTMVSPDNKTTLNDGAQVTSEELGTPQPKQPAAPLAREEQPHAAEHLAAKNETIVVAQEQRAHAREDFKAVNALAAEQTQRPEGNQPVALERPVQAQEIQGPKEEAAPRQPAVTPAAWQEPPSQDAESGMEWSGRDQRERASTDQVMPQAATPEAAAPAPASNPALAPHGVDHRAFSSAPSAKLSADAPAAATTPPVQPTDWMPGTSANQTKSMMLELSQADLGRVNIRVAVNQDTVHTHFASERNELGQYLVNGQDRLQSALQASGLDLGRFQVDIDRQSAGRSFQDPASREQSQGHASQGERQHGGQGREEAMRETAPRRGMLNLVA
ncbi:MAG: flagellar hook-length control protein FliK [Nitrospira sp.]|nr:flagellar hook-length control protein FliK [Nitrospira sp.]